MMREIFENYPKERIQSLPLTKFEGRVFVITTESDADKAVDYLMKQPILGFDTETRPSFKKWQRHTVSLLQVSTHDTCFLFRLHLTGMTKSIIRLLEDRNITKVGLSLRDDFHQLHERSPFNVGTFIDLQDEVKEIGVQDASLQKIFANLLGGKISKSQQLSNWEADILTDGQKTYAATDAWACIMIHEEIQRLAKTGFARVNSE